ncbi:MAG: GNAT family N-acetyltransferase [Salaquimonas sp.]
MAKTVEYAFPVHADIPAIIKFVKASWARTYDPVIGVEARKAKSDAKHVPALFQSEIDRKDAMALVAKHGGEVIGYVGGEMRGVDVFFIDHLHIDPDWYGRQIAAGMLEKLKTELEMNLKPRSMELTVLENNYRAIGFYNKTGFVEAKGANEDEGLGGVPSILMNWKIS